MAIFVPETVAQAWIRSMLVSSGDLVIALGNTNIYPNVSPVEVTGRHITHGFYGPSGGKRPTPLGRAVVQVGMIWRVTAWEPSYSQQALEPVMKAVMVALTGPEGRGITVRYLYGSDRFTIESEWAGPDIAPVESVPVGIWAPITHLYDLVVRPVV